MSTPSVMQQIFYFSPSLSFKWVTDGIHIHRLFNKISLSRLYSVEGQIWTMNWGKGEINCSWIILRYYPSVCLDGRRKTTKHLRQDRPPNYERWMLNTTSQNLVPVINLKRNTVLHTVYTRCSITPITQSAYIPSGLRTYSTWGIINTRTCVSDNGRAVRE
jgi:hypothetical protein